MVRSRMVSFILGALMSIAPAIMFGQHTSGSINGTVSDAEGQVIVGAEVTLTNRDTNVVSHAVTNANGEFVFLNIDPGPYTANIKKQGFRTVEIPAFNLTVNQSLTLNETMPVGTTSETVEVSADSMGVLLQKSSSELGTTIQAKEIQQLPLNGRPQLRSTLLQQHAHSVRRYLDCF